MSAIGASPRRKEDRPLLVGAARFLDLTPDGVKRLEPTIAKARQDGAALQKALDELNGASERVQARLRPARPQ